ncbi:hypothetical protein VTN96DRAFT_3664 [Rasamsonia emersonii]|uniref:Glycosyl hydrolase n=1 Tax=Rasamsonia emersonii (strain ATCC 16479 / CBS 393.64 / IMI 116815) TaxID=1408163 RepID=A0A0F4Z5K8_RASE3|nr:Glycosyl hydrolase [Rasamsonia emersonii CBS 393.64]KKA25148.1 Glycosyl hydrolase [Rasamsonia emersonii CBS 393.64]
MSPIACVVVLLNVLSVATTANVLAQRPDQKGNIVVPPQGNNRVEDSPEDDLASIRATLHDLIYALDVMQDEYFEHWLGTWPTSIDWTAAVLGTQVSAALSSLTSTPQDILVSLSGDSLARDALVHENLINRYFDQVSAFYFGENAISLRNQAFDDMLWVVLGWLESIKFQNLHSDLHYSSESDRNSTVDRPWHGTQLRVPAAHRARLFYELASQGWDNVLCGGGMVWSPYLTPYKNAITNELFISASIGMYLYFPGDPIDSPYLARGNSGERNVHDPEYLAAAVRGYQWLKDSNMTGFGGLYADGFHIRGWKSARDPGTRKCDVLNTMVYTYNQGVILSGLRGLWLATADRDYLQDGHELIEKVIWATGWPDTSSTSWAGLGRGGVLEEICDSSGDCSQNSHTFKGIFFHHLAEFCRPLRPEEEQLLVEFSDPEDPNAERSRSVFEWHQARCRSYRAWIEHNAQAALVTRNDQGKFGMWWGRPYPDIYPNITEMASPLPAGAVDYRNYGAMAEETEHLAGLMRVQSDKSPVMESTEIDQRKLGIFATETNSHHHDKQHPERARNPPEVNDRGRGRTVETQSGGLAVVRALYQWKISPSLH